MASYRPIRVGELIQEEIAELLLRHLKDPRLNMATVSRVDVSPDLRHAHVSISRMGNETEQQETIEGFVHATGFIRNQLGKRLKLRYVPELTFQLDTTIAHGVRISGILHDLAPADTTDVTEGNTPHA
jgi:ribosome-binding factor A